MWYKYIIFGQAFVHSVNVTRPYLNQRVLTCELIDSNYSDQLAGLDVWKTDVSKQRFTVRVKDTQEEKKLRLITNCTVVIKDLNKHVNKLDVRKARNRGLQTSNEWSNIIFEQFPTYTEMQTILFKWGKSKSRLGTFIPSIGKTVEGRDIFAFKVGLPEKKCRHSKHKKKQSIWVNGGLHAREWISPITVLFIIRGLLTDQSDEVERLLTRFDFHFTPLSNPDGYEYSMQFDRLWRKNRRPNDDGTFGVDLNRNWDEHWGVVGASRNPSDETYCGVGPSSEPEVQALMNYINQVDNPYGAIDFHSYGQMILRNWGWSSQSSSNEDHLAQIGSNMRDAYARNGFDFLSQTSAGLYPASGALDDWMAAKAQLVSYTIELCPGSDDSSGFQIPPNEILKCSSATFQAFKEFSNYLFDNPNIPHNQPLP